MKCLAPSGGQKSLKNKTKMFDRVAGNNYGSGVMPWHMHAYFMIISEEFAYLLSHTFISIRFAQRVEDGSIKSPLI